MTADSPSTLCLIIFIPKLLRFLLFLKRFRQIRSVTERWSSPTLNVDVFFSQTMVLVRSFHDTRGWSHTLANIPDNKTHKLLLNTPVMVQVAALRLFCRGGKHMINSIHISTSPHIKLCPSSKFFYDVVKTDSSPPPPREPIRGQTGTNLEKQYNPGQVQSLNSSNLQRCWRPNASRPRAASTQTQVSLFTVYWFSLLQVVYGLDDSLAVHFPA